VLATDLCTPHELGLVAVKLQSIGSQLFGCSVDTVSDCWQQHVHVWWRAAYKCTSVQMWWQPGSI